MLVSSINLWLLLNTHLRCGNESNHVASQEEYSW